MSQKNAFVEFTSRGITEMQQDVKILLEMFDDPEFEDETRLRAAGALLYLVAPGDLIPDTFGVLGSVDDVLVMRMTMDYALKTTPSQTSHYTERYPEVFESLAADLETAHGYLDEVYPWMVTYLARVVKIEFKGKKASAMLVDDDAGTWLYDELNEALLDLEYDDDELNRELRRVDRILPVLQEKMRATRS